MANQPDAAVTRILMDFNGKTDDWNVYREILEEFFTAQGISEKARVPVLISMIGKETYGVLRNLCHPQSPKDMEYDELCEVLARQYLPEIVIFQRRAKFYQAEQRRGESVKEFYARLKALLVDCDFDDDQLEPVLLDRFVIGLVPGPVQSMLYEIHPKKLKTIEEALDMAAKKEATLAQERDSDEMAHEFACLGIGNERRYGRHRRHGRHAHRFGGFLKDIYERHGHHRHGRHRHRHSDREMEDGHLSHFGRHGHGHHGHGPHGYGPHGHGPHGHGPHGHGPHGHGPHGHGAPSFGPPAFGGPGSWGGHLKREMPHFGLGAPWMGGFGRYGRPCGKWRKRHYHRRSSSSSSSSSSSGESNSSSSESSSSDSETPNEQEVEQQEQKKGRKMCHGGKHLDKRHGGKRHGHGRHHHHRGHRHDHRHGKHECRRQRKQPKELTVPEQTTEPTTEPELIE